jgi:hypothetical protein
MYDDFIQLFILFLMPYMLRLPLIYIYIDIYYDYDHEGMSFMTFVRRSLYPWGNNASRDEGH